MKLTSGLYFNIYKCVINFSDTAFKHEATILTINELLLGPRTYISGTFGHVISLVGKDEPSKACRVSSLYFLKIKNSYSTESSRASKILHFGTVVHLL